ncbi:MAG: hypothetical protein ABI051_10660 [Vicinamibacterales bacterium]
MLSRSLARVVILVAGALSVLAASQQKAPVSSLPSRLTDRELWQLSTSLSEPGGYFRSDNLVSNEHTFQYVVPALAKQVTPGGVYLGVAPDQNFTYILATAPQMAFIVDIRRGNLLQHLLYKALIELSRDRAEFVSRLFSRPRAPSLAPESTGAALFAAFGLVEASEPLYRQNLAAVTDRLVKYHHFTLSSDDLEQIDAIYFAFFSDGPEIQYSVGPGFGGRGRGFRFPSYQDLMTATDVEGAPHSYLANEANYAKLKDMEERNLIVPVVGDFAGPKALRSVGRYVREHGAAISTFYVSNVEQYLYQDGIFSDFARNVATLPLTSASTFVRSVSARSGYAGENLGPDGRATALYPIRAFVRDFQAGRLRTYYDLNALSR